jgi:integrase
MAHFRKRGDGWQANIEKRGVRDSKTFTLKGDAQAWANRREAEIDAGEHGIPNLTLDAVLVRYKDKVSPKKKGAKWELARIGLLRRDRVAAVGLRDFGKTHVADWRDRRLESVSAASVRREWNLLNHACNLAVNEWGWLKVNPFKLVKRPEGSQPRTRIATAAEIAKLDANASAKLRRIIVWALETGMRASEIAAVDTVVGNVAKLADTKNGTSRDVPLSAAALKVWDGQPFGLTAGSISGLFARLCKDCKIEGLTFHDLRATAATRLSKKLNPLQLAKMFGWKDMDMALIYYRETAEDVAKLL